MREANERKSLESVSEYCNEAERLLAELDAEDNFSNEQNEEPLADIKSQDHQQEIEQRGPNNQGAGCLVTAIGATLLVAIAMSLQSKYATQNEYETAMQAGKDAVLIAEHEQAIKRLEAVKEKGINPSTMDSGLLNNRIIRSRKLMRYLDQPGRAKYQEEADYGYQWYNKHGSSAYKLFFAHSRKCKNPLIRFTYRKTENGPIVGATSVKPKATMSTLNVPYRNGASWLYLTSFRCN